MATNYTINYDDPRFADVESEKKSALNQINKTYNKMINQSDKYYQAQMDAAKQYGETQAKNQQAQTDFTIEQINQQKDQAQKDYTKEQSGAYVDWQKQSGQYGVNAEQMAAQGMANSGYSESSQVSMYNTYQNRVATARESYNRAVLNYDNAIKDARLQNNAALAEIAYNALQTQLELSLEGFQYKNQLILAKSDKQLEVDNTYYGRYQDVLKQLNTENALAEEVRQYNESLAEEQRQYNNSLALQKDELQLQKDKFAYEKAQDAAGAYTPTKTKYTSTGSRSGTRKKGSTGKGWISTGSGRKSTKAVTKTNTTKNTSKPSSSQTIDMDSVIALGYGPISEAKLKSLVDSGVVQQYTSGNKIKFKKSPYALKQSNLFR